MPFKGLLVMLFFKYIFNILPELYEVVKFLTTTLLGALTTLKFIGEKMHTPESIERASE